MNGKTTGDTFLRRLTWLTVAAVVILVTWFALSWIERTRVRVAAEPRPITPRGDLAADEKTNIEIFEHSRGSVVFISTTQQVMDFWSRDVFTIPRGTGSGFIWDNQGHIVTNNHVIEGAAEARVRLSDGKEYRASLVGASRSHDLAVLQIRTTVKHGPLPLGTSKDLKVGQKVFAIGNPFGLDWTLTTGIVSALDRSLKEESGTVIEHLIQTDAAINPGNSGGPLLDSAGRLIGVNTAIYSPSGASAGVGFAVPVDTVNRVVPELISHGRYIRPSLGIGTDRNINELLSERLGVKGVLVLKVAPGSAAAAAGIRSARMERDGTFIAGDIITAINGRQVGDVPDMLAMLDDYRVGDRVKLTLNRDGREVEKEVTLQAE